MTTRTYFLEQFLGALGATEIQWASVAPDHVRGTVVYDPTDPEEWQDFIWEITEAEVPRKEVVLLAEMIRAQRLLSIDKLVVGRQELERRYAQYTGGHPSATGFGAILDEPETIEVSMLDDGEKSDYYFIHE